MAWRHRSTTQRRRLRQRLPGHMQRKPRPGPDGASRRCSVARAQLQLQFLLVGGAPAQAATGLLVVAVAFVSLSVSYCRYSGFIDETARTFASLANACARSASLHYGCASVPTPLRGLSASARSAQQPRYEVSIVAQQRLADGLFLRVFRAAGAVPGPCPPRLGLLSVALRSASRSFQQPSAAGSFCIFRSFGTLRFFAFSTALLRVALRWFSPQSAHAKLYVSGASGHY